MLLLVIAVVRMTLHPAVVFVTAATEDEATGRREAQVVG